MINVSIIGYGKMGRIRHEVISKRKDVNLFSIYEPSDIEIGIQNVKETSDIINNSEIEAVYICTPNYLNKNLTISCLESGKHVFCEKPPAFNQKDVEEIIKAEKKSGKVLMYGLNHRHHESIKRMKKMVDENSLGEILWMRGRYGKSVNKNFYNNWRSKKELAGGGILIDQGIHMIDLFLYFGGDFDKVHASISNLYWKLDVEDNVFATLENTKSGIAASLHSTMTQWRHLFSFEIFLEKGYMVLNGLLTSSKTYGDEILTISKNRSIAPAAIWEDEENISYFVDESWNSEAEEFFSSIKSKRKVRIGNSSDALKLMQIIDKIYSYRKMEM